MFTLVEERSTPYKKVFHGPAKELIEIPTGENSKDQGKRIGLERLDSFMQEQRFADFFTSRIDHDSWEKEGREFLHAYTYNSFAPSKNEHNQTLIEINNSSPSSHRLDFPKLITTAFLPILESEEGLISCPDQNHFYVRSKLRMESVSKSSHDPVHAHLTNNAICQIITDFRNLICKESSYPNDVALYRFMYSTYFADLQLKISNHEDYKWIQTNAYEVLEKIFAIDPIAQALDTRKIINQMRYTSASKSENAKTLLKEHSEFIKNLNEKYYLPHLEEIVEKFRDDEQVVRAMNYL